MPERQSPELFLAACAVDLAVFQLRPDYRALLLVVDWLDPEAASPLADDALRASADALSGLGTEVHVSRRLVGAP